MKRIIITLVIAGLCFHESIAQAFVQSVDIMQLIGANCSLTKEDGTEITGKFRGMLGSPNNMKGVYIKSDASGKQEKIPIAEFKRVSIEPGKFLKLQLFGEEQGLDMSSKKGQIRAAIAVGSNWDAIFDKMTLTYDKVPQEKDPSKFGVRQLINPGFDSKVQVYEWSGNVQVMGKVKYKYAFVKDGATIITNERQYKEDFPKIFGDCPTLIEDVGDPIFEGIAYHTFWYDQGCND